MRDETYLRWSLNRALKGSLPPLNSAFDVEGAGIRLRADGSLAMVFKLKQVPDEIEWAWIANTEVLADLPEEIMVDAEFVVNHVTPEEMIVWIDIPPDSDLR
jgi:hypothetical protein